MEKRNCALVCPVYLLQSHGGPEVVVSFFSLDNSTVTPTPSSKHYPPAHYRSSDHSFSTYNCTCKSVTSKSVSLMG